MLYLLPEPALSGKATSSNLWSFNTVTNTYSLLTTTTSTLFANLLWKVSSLGVRTVEYYDNTSAAECVLGSV